jgi:hypothetical protein
MVLNRVQSPARPISRGAEMYGIAKRVGLEEGIAACSVYGEGMQKRSVGIPRTTHGGLQLVE